MKIYRVGLCAIVTLSIACNNPRQTNESPEDRVTQGATAGAGEETTITPNNPADVLPQTAKQFIETHFADLTIRQVENKKSAITDGTVFEVTLSNQTELDFDKDGEWRELNAEDGETIPMAVLPNAIRDYLNAQYAGIELQSVDKELEGYALELTNDRDLLFDLDGNFQREDR
ncbi:MAG: PepSY-like domain-containing protein [Sphingobacterium sp.]